MPEKVISSALWQQMELRQKVMNARESDMELELSTKCVEDGAAAVEGASRDTTMSIMTISITAMIMCSIRIATNIIIMPMFTATVETTPILICMCRTRFHGVLWWRSGLAED